MTQQCFERYGRIRLVYVGQLVLCVPGKEKVLRLVFMISGLKLGDWSSRGYYAVLLQIVAV